MNFTYGYKLNALKYLKRILFVCIPFTLITSCEKLIEIEPPTSSITTTQTFQDSINATSSLLGLYTNISDRYGSIFSSGYISKNFALYADELQPFGNLSNERFYTAEIDRYFGQLWINLWGKPYSFIYHANSIIEETQKSTGININNKKQLIAEAKFWRAYCYLYLVTFFGDVPLIISSNYKDNQNPIRTSKTLVYEQMIQDLKSAVSDLPDNYTISRNERVRANKFAAAALLARIYIICKKWSEAEESAKLTIDRSDLFSIEDDLNNAFNSNQKEAILQLYINPTVDPFNGTGDGMTFIPDFGLAPRYFFREEFIASFEPGDLRRTTWIDSTRYRGIMYYYPRKYRIGPFDTYPNLKPTQQTTILRLSEQYLIRAEARMNLNNITGAISDIKVVRNRAKLETDDAIVIDDLRRMLMNERKVELFTEQAIRWIDMVRFQVADSINSKIKPNWQTYKNILPIPNVEMVRNPSLKQNNGYN